MEPKENPAGINKTVRDVLDSTITEGIAIEHSTYDMPMQVVATKMCAMYKRKESEIRAIVRAELVEELRGKIVITHLYLGNSPPCAMKTVKWSDIISGMEKGGL